MSNILKFANPIRVGSLASDPVDAEDGVIYYNSSTGKFRKYEGGSFGDIASGDVLDTVFRISDDGDVTKKIAFQASGISTGTVRTITMPDSNVNLGLVATAIQSTEKGAANGVATLDAGGLLPTAQLPPLAITSVFVVANQAARLALTAEMGDVAIQTDNSLTYILSTNSPSTNADWKVITAAGAVTSVNGQTGTVSLTTTDIAQGTNLYYTATQARSDILTATITNGDTTHAPNGDAVFDALALKLSSVSQDTAPQLGGDLDLNGKTLMGTLHRSASAAASNFIEEEYLHAITLTASQTNTVLASLSFAFASFEAIEVSYKIKEATTNRIRLGKLRIISNGTDISVVDDFNETADAGVSWSAVVNGASIDVRYTTTANNKTMRADVKRFKA